MKSIRFLLAIVLLALPLSVSACGKKVKPIPPEGSDFPHTYPRR
jgi:hypothetical protein